MSTFHGSQAKFAMKTDNTVASSDAQGGLTYSMEQDGGVHSVHETGDRDPQEIKEGKIEIDGEFERDYESGNYSAVGSTLQQALESGTEVFPAIFPEGDASPKILMNNAKIGHWRISVDLDGEVKEAVRYKGKTIDIS